MEAHGMLQAAHNTIDRMLLETVAVVAGEEQGVEIDVWCNGLLNYWMTQTC